jgi:hypothetical protein
LEERRRFLANSPDRHARSVLPIPDRLNTGLVADDTAQVTAPDRTGWTFGSGLLSGRPQVRVLPRAPDPDADGAEGAGRIGTLRSRIGLPGEPVDQLLVVASIRARPFPEPIAILRGCACSDTGSVTVSTPRS